MNLIIIYIKIFLKLFLIYKKLNFHLKNAQIFKLNKLKIQKITITHLYMN